MPVMTIVYVFYALVLIAGGVMGFIKAGSKISLISGLVMGILVTISSYLYASTPKLALMIGTFLSCIAATFFIVRLIKTKKAMPAVPMIIISDGVFLASLILLLSTKS
jgi:uncharacterized membrane protein (UPF0136 family)